MSIYVFTVNPLYHWFQILFRTRLRISLRVLYSFRGTVFLIPLRRLSRFLVSPGLVVPAPAIRFIYGYYKKLVGVVKELIRLNLYLLVIFTPYYYPSPPLWKVVTNIVSSSLPERAYFRSSM